MLREHKNQRCIMNTAVYALVDNDADRHALFGRALSKILPNPICLYFFSCTDARRYFQDEAIMIPKIIFADWRLVEVEGKDCILNLCNISDLQDSLMYIYSDIQNLDMRRRYSDKYNIRFLAKQNSVDELVKQLEQIA